MTHLLTNLGTGALNICEATIDAVKNNLDRTLSGIRQSNNNPTPGIGVAAQPTCAVNTELGAKNIAQLTDATSANDVCPIKPQPTCALISDLGFKSIAQITDATSTNDVSSANVIDLLARATNKTPCTNGVCSANVMDLLARATSDQIKPTVPSTVMQPFVHQKGTLTNSCPGTEENFTLLKQLGLFLDQNIGSGIDAASKLLSNALDSLIGVFSAPSSTPQMTSLFPDEKTCSTSGLLCELTKYAPGGNLATLAVGSAAFVGAYFLAKKAFSKPKASKQPVLEKKQPETVLKEQLAKKAPVRTSVDAVVANPTSESEKATTSDQSKKPQAAVEPTTTVATAEKANTQELLEKQTNQLLHDENLKFFKKVLEKYTEDFKKISAQINNNPINEAENLKVLMLCKQIIMLKTILLLGFANCASSNEEFNREFFKLQTRFGEELIQRQALEVLKQHYKAQSSPTKGS